MHAELTKDGIIDGINLFEFSLFEKEPERTFFYYGFDNTVFAVRQGKWKLHIRTNSQTGKTYFEDPLPLLFDLETDPSEQYNLATEHPEIVKELQVLFILIMKNLLLTLISIALKRAMRNRFSIIP